MQNIKMIDEPVVERLTCDNLEHSILFNKYNFRLES